MIFRRTHTSAPLTVATALARRPGAGRLAPITPAMPRSAPGWAPSLAAWSAMRLFGSTLGTVGGAAAGALIGNEVGKNNDRGRGRCGHRH